MIAACSPTYPATHTCRRYPTLVNLPYTYDVPQLTPYLSGPVLANSDPCTCPMHPRRHNLPYTCGAQLTLCFCTRQRDCRLLARLYPPTLVDLPYTCGAQLTLCFRTRQLIAVCSPDFTLQLMLADLTLHSSTYPILVGPRTCRRAHHLTRHKTR